LIERPGSLHALFSIWLIEFGALISASVKPKIVNSLMKEFAIKESFCSPANLAGLCRLWADLQVQEQ